MKDTFDLTKFLKENKSLENLNPTFKSFNDVKSNETKKSLVENIKSFLRKPRPSLLLTIIYPLSNY